MLLNGGWLMMNLEFLTLLGKFTINVQERNFKLLYPQVITHL